MDFKKLFANQAGDIVAPFVEGMVKETLSGAFQKLKEKDPEAAKVAVSSIYPAADKYLEDFTKKTETKLDDAVTNGLKGACEDFAKAEGFQLTNVDAD